MTTLILYYGNLYFNESLWPLAGLIHPRESLGIEDDLRSERETLDRWRNLILISSTRCVTHSVRLDARGAVGKRDRWPLKWEPVDLMNVIKGQMDWARIKKAQSSEPDRA